VIRKQFGKERDGRRFAAVWDPSNPGHTKVVVYFTGTSELAKEKAMRFAVTDYWASYPRGAA
jgi:hypothetical protein